jgi:hypothetical protein
MTDLFSTRRKRFLGFLLMVLGFICGPVGAIGFAIHLLGLGLGVVIRSWAVLSLLGMMLCPILIIVGWLLTAGRKELILFLRRFGNESLNDAVRNLVQTRLRRRFRLVTLDDSEFHPVGPMWSGLLVSLSPAALVLFGILFSYAGFAKMAQSELMDETPFGSALVLIQIGIIVLGALAFFVCLALTAAAVRAHFTARRTIDCPDSLRRVMRRLRRLKRLVRAPSIAAPMATVVTTTDTEWQPTVAAVASLCEVVLLDLSSPSLSINWELETVLSLGLRVIILAHRKSFDGWWYSQPDDQDSTIWARLRELAQGLPLVLYDEPDQLGQTQLTDMLQKPSPATPLSLGMLSREG